MNFLKIITPTNLSEEYEKFSQSPSYHPIFMYDWNSEEIEAWLHKRTQYEKLVRAILTQENEVITTEGERYFDVKWDGEYYELASGFLKLRVPQVRIPSLRELVKAQQDFLDALEIDYLVEIVDAHGFVARPNHGERKLQISKYTDYFYFSMESSVRHDGVHIIRYLNGKHNRIQKSDNYLPTEEGLACYMQDYGGTEPNNSLFQHAAEYTVTKICREGSLRDAIDYLISIGFPSKLAWQRASRHKFGFVDTSKPGDIMKPAMYFSNSQSVGKLSKAKRLKLFVGKTSLTDLKDIHEYTGIWDQNTLSQIFNNLV